MQGNGPSDKEKDGGGNKDSEAKREKKPEDEGFEQGLKLWLFFLVGFFVLGYGLPASILLGAAAGYSTGFIVASWKMEGNDQDLDQMIQGGDVDVHEAIRLQREKRYEEGRKRKRKSGRIPLFGWLFPSK
jgi:hypothetical protein